MHPTLDSLKLCVVSKINTTQEVNLYIRKIKIDRDGEQYGTYYQAVRSYRKGGKVKQEVIHLGQHTTVETALDSWPKEIKELKRTRPKQADKLQEKLERLRKLTKKEQSSGLEVDSKIDSN